MTGVLTLADVKARIKPRPTRTSARVWKRTPQRALGIYNALASGMGRIAAARQNGIDDNTMFRWMADDPAFTDMVEEAEGIAEAKYTTAVYLAASQGTWQAAAWWLERRRPSLYGRRDRMDVSVDIRVLAESLARAEGLDADELMSEAMHILDVHKERLRLSPGE